MDYKKISGWSLEDLQKELATLRGTLYGLKMQTSVNQLRKFHEIKETKRVIARVLTRLAELKNAN